MSDDRWEGRGGPVNKRPSSFQTTKYKAPRWHSKVAPGTPPSVEALFIMIRKSLTEGFAFNYAKRQLKGVSDEKLWEFYSQWCEGKVHPELMEHFDKTKKT